MCKYCDSDNVSYDNYFTDCHDGEHLPLFKNRIIDESFNNNNDDDISNCVVGIIDNQLVLRMPSYMGYGRCDLTIMGASTINYCPMCGRKLN